MFEGTRSGGDTYLGLLSSSCKMSSGSDASSHASSGVSDETGGLIADVFKVVGGAVGIVVILIVVYYTIIIFGALLFGMNEDAYDQKLSRIKRKLARLVWRQTSGKTRHESASRTTQY